MTVSSASRWPLTRPVLARTSSAASGFFFCGMIDEPVEKASDSLTKPNCGVDQMTISSASRDRCVARDRRERQELQREVAVGNAVERVAGRLAEAERLRRRCRSIGKPVPASAAAPSGLSSMRSMASRTRDRSRPNIST